MNLHTSIKRWTKQSRRAIEKGSTSLFNKLNRKNMNRTELLSLLTELSVVSIEFDKLSNNEILKGKYSSASRLATISQYIKHATELTKDIYHDFD